MPTEKEIVEGVANAVIAQKDYLQELDSKIGDGDHGVNMARGFTAVLDAVDEMEDPSNLSALFKTIGQTLVENVGGAAGPLYGTAFIEAAKSIDAHPEMTVQVIEKALAAAIEGIESRGRAEQGDKTMLDVLIPIHNCFKPENANGKTLTQCLNDASKAAKDGVEFTKTIAAKRGRASNLGEKSIGTEDPGAVSSMIMYRAFLETLRS